jgi:hypothetical protein
MSRQEMAAKYWPVSPSASTSSRSMKRYICSVCCRSWLTLMKWSLWTAAAVIAPPALPQAFPMFASAAIPGWGFGRQKMHALSLCRNEWVLNLDADEELTDSYLRELLDCLKRDDADALESGFHYCWQPQRYSHRVFDSS